MRLRFSETNHKRIAVVVDDDVAFGIVRMYMAYSDDVPVRINVFRDLDGARTWLDMPAEYELPFD